MKEIVFIDINLDVMGGVERIINTLANSLVNEYQVKVISLFKTTNEPHFEYNDKVQYTYFYDKTNLLSKKFQNFKLIYFPLFLFEKVIQKLSIKIKTYATAKKFNSNQIVVFGRVSATVDFLKIIKNNIKIVVRDAIHLKYTEYFNPELYWVLKEQFPNKVNKLIVSSDESINNYNDFFKGSVDIIKIYNPLGIEPKNGLSNNKVVLSMGRYSSQKGYENLVLAWKNVSLKYSDWTLKIVGINESDECHTVLSNINSIISQNNIGNILLSSATKDVVEELVNSSIYVVPSRYEGYANSLVEALACGLPSISYNWYLGVDDIIKHNINGLVVPLKDRYKYMVSDEIDEFDVENLSKAIIELIENEKLRERFKREALNIIDSRNRENIVNQWKETILK